MLKSYKYKLKPNEEQIILLNKHFGSIRFIYNYFLNERKREYETNKNTINYYDNARDLTKLKQLEKYSWLNEINSQSQQHALKCLDGAYQNFFKFKKGFPKFKSKKSKNSFSVPQNVKLQKGKLSIPKFKEPIDLVLHRSFSGKIKSCTISRTPTNEYFVSILVETEHKKFEKTGKSIGIDLGLKDFVITSDGQKFKNNRYTKTYERTLKKQQQHLSRKKKGSNSYEKQRLKVANLHKKITNSRLDNLHKVSTDLIRKYDTIILEDLNIKGMVKNHKLAKHISDASWSKFIELLTYKAEWNDKQIVKIDRFFPSSKTCNCCGYINQNLKLDIREWTCPSCNTKLDRDYNASINILNEGYKIISDGTSDYRSGGEIRPNLFGTTDEISKVLDIYISEAQPSLVVG
jgi:putative transposase